MASSYEDLVVWQLAMDLVKLIYRCTQSFPKAELYGLTSQMQRAAVSIPSNIAEGQGRRSRPEFYEFLSKARGSLMELETQARIAQHLNYIDTRTTDAILVLSARVGRMLNGLMSSLKARTTESASS